MFVIIRFGDLLCPLISKTQYIVSVQQIYLPVVLYGREKCLLLLT